MLGYTSCWPFPGASHPVGDQMAIDSGLYNSAWTMRQPGYLFRPRGWKLNPLAHPYLMPFPFVLNKGAALNSQPTVFHSSPFLGINYPNYVGG